MSQQSSPPGSPDDRPKGDPWHAFSYVVAGVLMYGALGWLVDWWLGTRFLVAVGIVFGAGLGLYRTWTRFGSITSHDQTHQKPQATPQQHPDQQPEQPPEHEQ